MENVSERLHWVRISCFSKRGNGELVEGLFWDNLPWVTRQKYDWYFRYRAALLQVKYPKSHIEHNWGHLTAPPKTMKQVLRNRIIAKKGKITEFKNKVSKARSQWNDLYPIDDHPNYQKALKKLERLKKELIEHQEEFNNIK